MNCGLRTVIPRTVSKLEGRRSEADQLHHPLCPEANALQKNLTATKRTQEYTITWSADDNIRPDSLEANEIEEQGRGRDTGSGEFVRSLLPGDVITVWGKARFPGWTNYVEKYEGRCLLGSIDGERW